MKKGIIILLGFLILVLAAGVGVVFWKYSAQKPSDPGTFLKNLQEKMVKENWLGKDSRRLSLEQPSQDKYAGKDWLNEKNEVELLKGYSLDYDAIDRSAETAMTRRSDAAIPEAIMETAQKIEKYLLSQGLKRNSRNTAFFGPEEKEREENFWKTSDEAVGGRLAFEKGNIKCLLGSLNYPPFGIAEVGFSLFCADITQSTTPPEYHAIWHNANPDQWLGFVLFIDNNVDNFVLGASGGYGGGAAGIWMEKEGKWVNLVSTQNIWSCKTLLDNKVPPALFPPGPKNECIFFIENPRECLGYEKECQEQEKREQKEFNYQELYEERYGKKE